MLVTDKPFLIKSGRWLYAVPLMAMGIAHFYYPDLVTAGVPAYLPAKTILNYIAGAVLFITAGAIFFKYYTAKAALILGVFLLIFALLYSAPILALNIKDAGQWTDLLLDLAVAAGAFFASAKLNDNN